MTRPPTSPEAPPCPGWLVNAPRARDAIGEGLRRAYRATVMPDDILRALERLRTID